MILRNFARVFLQARDFSRCARDSSTLSACIDELGRASVILKSTSTDIYENLALEDWINDHIDLQKRSILLLWRNAPAVVIGRHQNPWQECNLGLMRQTRIPLARRRSGGGTVFHDLGNINMTFFTSKKKYDRHRNLCVVTSALKGLRPNLDVKATERFDILLNGHYKISGTAAKLGRTAAYHHCTLLCSADRAVLSSVLRSTCQGIKSNATPSVPSPVRNLLDEDPTLDTESIVDALASQYDAEFGFESSVVLVNPHDDKLLPGIQKMADELRSWEWLYGRTPGFSISTSFEVDHISKTTVTLHMDIKNGIIESCAIGCPKGWLQPEVSEEFGSLLVGSKLCPSETALLAAAHMRALPQRDDATATKIYTLCEKIVSVM